jgi:hypothetical protein
MQKILLSDEVMVPKNLKEDKRIVLGAQTVCTCINSINHLWYDRSVKSAFQNRIEFNLPIPDCAEYFFDNAERIAEDNFQPTNEDILRTELKNTGITELSYHNPIDFWDTTIVHVGGSHLEWRKWIHYFDDCLCVIFMAALDDYNMKSEDNQTNRLEESLHMFNEMTSLQFLGRPISCILFLNNSDIFKDKTERFPVSEYFSDCKAKNYDQSIEYMKKKYEANFRGSGIYIYVTGALDSFKNFQKVNTMMTKISLSRSMEEYFDL